MQAKEYPMQGAKLYLAVGQQYRRSDHLCSTNGAPYDPLPQGYALSLVVVVVVLLAMRRRKGAVARLRDSHVALWQQHLLASWRLEELERQRPVAGNLAEVAPEAHDG